AYSRALPRAIPPPCRFLPRRASSPGTPFASRVGHPVCSLVQACSRALPRAIPPPCRFLPRRASSPGTPFASRVGHPVEGGALGVLVGPGIFSRATTRDTTTLPLPAPASKLAGDPVRVEGGGPGSWQVPGQVRAGEICCRGGGWLLCWLRFTVSHFGTPCDFFQDEDSYPHRVSQLPVAGS